MLKKYFVTGLLIWVPLGITLWIIHALVHDMDLVLLLLPSDARPDRLLGFHVPGLGVVLMLAVITATGLFAANFFGRRIVQFWERVLARIPVVKSIYSSVKQVSDTLLSSSGEAFRKAVLVPYPHPGSHTIAFLTGQPSAQVARHLDGEHISVYVPTTPNPTSGFFLIVAKKDVVELDLSVDEALKYVISMGVVAPGERADH